MMKLNRFLACVALLMAISDPIYSSDNYEISFKKAPHESNDFPYVPVPYLRTLNGDLSFSNHFVSVFKNDIEGLEPIFGLFFDVKVLENGAIEIVKDNFHSGQAAHYYTEQISNLTGNCINSYPSDSPDDNLELISLLEFLEKLVGTNQKDAEKQEALIASLKKQSNLLLGFIAANNGFCSDEVGSLPRLPKNRFKGLSNYIDSSFMWHYDLPDPYWTKIARKGLYELVASENGFWNQLAKKELPNLYTQTLQKMVVNKVYFDSVVEREFADFYEFATDFRGYLKVEQKSLANLEAIGVGCFSSVEETFKPFKLGKCIDKNRLKVLTRFATDGIVIVRNSND